MLELTQPQNEAGNCLVPVYIELKLYFWQLPKNTTFSLK